jgi:hypothetical protein
MPDNYPSKTSDTFFWIVSALIPPGLILAAIIIVQVILQGSGNSLGLVTVFWTLINGPLTIGIGLAIIWRVRRNPMGPLLVLWGVQNSLWAVPTEFMKPITAAFALGAGIVGVYLFIYFPNGKPFPARAAPLYQAGFIVLVLNGILFMLAHPTFQTVLASISEPHPFHVPWLAPLQKLSEALFYFSLCLWIWGPMTLVLRYRSATNKEQNQIKWMAFLALLLIPIAASLILAYAFWGKAGPPLYAGYLAVCYTFIQVAPSVFIGISILRYRLWDIDVVIRKTLVYTILTAALVVVYFGSVTLLQTLSASILDLQPPAIIVLSTLGIAALFNPLRKRIQGLIDRRFYRSKYDAEKALAEFAAAARSETDIDQLSTELLAVLEKTMQPEQVSVWLTSEGEKG